MNKYFSKCMTHFASERMYSQLLYQYTTKRPILGEIETITMNKILTKTPVYRAPPLNYIFLNNSLG